MGGDTCLGCLTAMLPNLLVRLESVSIGGIASPFFGWATLSVLNVRRKIEMQREAVAYSCKQRVRQNRQSPEISCILKSQMFHCGANLMFGEDTIASQHI